jgi:RNA polymerase nonessential primary-like sigma factor
VPSRHRAVLARRFGLLGHDTQTLEQVGQEIGLTRERVRQIQIEALQRLRSILGREGIDYTLLVNLLEDTN